MMGMGKTMVDDEESFLGRDSVLRPDTDNLTSIPITTSTLSTPLIPHEYNNEKTDASKPFSTYPLTIDPSTMPFPGNPTPMRRRGIMNLFSLPSWIWASLLAIILSSIYLYGYSDLEVPGTEYVDILRHKFHFTDLRIEKLPSKFRPETGKHRHSGRLVIVGDVHGMLDELDALLEKVNFNSKNDHLILTGDMIDKGPNSAGVIDRAIELGASCVMGNHEENAIKHNSATFKSLSKKGQKWVKACPHILKVGKLGRMGNVRVVHAGLMPGRKLRKQKTKDVMKMRTINRKGKPSKKKFAGPNWFEAWNKFQNTLPKKSRSTVIYGHFALLGLQDHEYTKGLDTGCSNGDSLTAIVIEGGATFYSHSFVSVGCRNRRKLAATEEGESEERDIEA